MKFSKVVIPVSIFLSVAALVGFGLTQYEVQKQNKTINDLRSQQTNIAPGVATAASTQPTPSYDMFVPPRLAGDCSTHCYTTVPSPSNFAPNETWTVVSSSIIHTLADGKQMTVVSDIGQQGIKPQGELSEFLRDTDKIIFIDSSDAPEARMENLYAFQPSTNSIKKMKTFLDLQDSIATDTYGRYIHQGKVDPDGEIRNLVIDNFLDDSEKVIVPSKLPQSLSYVLGFSDFDGTPMTDVQFDGKIIRIGIYVSGPIAVSGSKTLVSYNDIPIEAFPK